MSTKLAFIVAGVIACGCSQRPLPLPYPELVADLGTTDLSPSSSPVPLDLASGLVPPADLAAAPRSGDLARAPSDDMARAPSDDMARAMTGDMATPPICANGLRLPSVPLVATSYPPTTVARADFDGDGILDLVSDAGSEIEVHFGNGDGTFKPATKYGPLGTNQLITDDFNGDGKPDILVIYSTINVALNQGDGTFNNSQLQWFKGVPVGGFMSQAMTGDFNHDGKRDVAAALGDEVIVALGNGDGTFAPIAKYPTGLVLSSVLVGDLDGDGNADLVGVMHAGYAYSSSSDGDVGVLLGNGDGTFRAIVHYGAPDSGGSGFGALADVNNDGKLDVLASELESNLVRVFLGNGDGTLRTATTFAANSVGHTTVGSDYVAAIEVDDFNGDGKLDVATTEPVNQVDYDNFINVSLGNGDGTFRAAFGATTGSAPTALLSGDFDRDGKLDIVTVDGQGGLGMLLGKGDGTFRGADRYFLTDSPSAIASGDFNGDGKLDFALAEVHNGGRAQILLGGANGRFIGAGSYSIGDWPRNIAAADVDGDGKLDLVVTRESGIVPDTSDSVAVLPGKGDGSFSAPQSHAVGGAPAALAIADLDGNGTLDIVTADHGTSTVSVLLGRGKGAFATAVQYATGNLTIGVAVGDFNHDGRLDIVASGYNGTLPADTVVLFLGKGDGTFAKAVNVGGLAGPIASADFNGDGNLDIVGGFDGYPGPYGVVVLLGKGDGTFSASAPSSSDTYYPGIYYPNYSDAVAVADVNGDGKPDVVVESNTNDDVSVLLGKGDGTFWPSSDYAGGWRPNALTTGDFDGDGKLDIAAVATGETTGYGELSVLFNRGCR